MDARMRRASSVAAGAAVLALAGCGGDDADYANEPRPPTPIVITASISNERVSVSPREFGAGPISLIVTNQTGQSQQVTLESAGTGPGIKQQSGPINPRDTATLEADVKPGDYTVAVGQDGIAEARLQVGAERKTAQDDLLLP